MLCNPGPLLGRLDNPLLRHLSSTVRGDKKAIQSYQSFRATDLIVPALPPNLTSCASFVELVVQQDHDGDKIALRP